jgi:hypothetical protein
MESGQVFGKREFTGVHLAHMYNMVPGKAIASDCEMLLQAIPVISNRLICFYISIVFNSPKTTC